MAEGGWNPGLSDCTHYDLSTVNTVVPPRNVPGTPWLKSQISGSYKTTLSAQLLNRQVTHTARVATSRWPGSLESILDIGSVGPARTMLLCLRQKGK